MKIFITTLLLILTSASAEAQRHSVRIQGRGEAIVSGSSISLEDIADIIPQAPGFDDTVLLLNKISLEKSPAPGEVVKVSGINVVEALKREKVDLKSVAYSLPQTITVKRASRPLRDDEVTAAITKALESEGRDISFKGIEVVGSREVFPGEIVITARSSGEVRPGSIPFSLKVESRDKESIDLQVRARLEEYMSLPVARHSLPRGALVNADDIVMARLNVNGLPADTTADPNRVVGFETSRQVVAGSSFQLSDLKMPPVVTNGAKVTMVFKSGALEATAAGTALQDGALGEEIKIRNEQSKKIVRGRVEEAGLIRVR